MNPLTGLLGSCGAFTTVAAYRSQVVTSAAAMTHSGMRAVPDKLSLAQDDVVQKAPPVRRTNRTGRQHGKRLWLDHVISGA